MQLNESHHFIAAQDLIGITWILRTTSNKNLCNADVPTCMWHTDVHCLYNTGVCTEYTCTYMYVTLHPLEGILL